MDNPVKIHPNRKSIRLKDFDYASPGAYFVTIATHDRWQIFGTITQVGVSLSEFGAIAREQWLQLPQRFPNIENDTFVVMPDHIHGIIFIADKPIAGSVSTGMGSRKGCPYASGIP